MQDEISGTTRVAMCMIIFAATLGAILQVIDILRATGTMNKEILAGILLVLMFVTVLGVLRVKRTKRKQTNGSIISLRKGDATHEE